MRDYPLQWPDDWPRSSKKKTSRFKTSLAKSLSNVKDELRKFAKDSGVAVHDVIISSNVTLGKQNPDDAGVAIYFEWDGIDMCIAVDVYKTVQDNLQAIYHCIEAERTKMRHGGINLVRAGFRGYAALTSPDEIKYIPGMAKSWSKELGVDEHSSLEVVTRAYKNLARKYHPDVYSGSEQRFTDINNAFEAAKSEIAARGKK